MGFITETAYQYYNTSQKFTANALQQNFDLTFDPLPSLKADFLIFINGSEIEDDLYGYDPNTGRINFTLGRTAGEIVIVKLKKQKLGNYRYISLNDIINNYIVAYVGDGKLINDVKKNRCIISC